MDAEPGLPEVKDARERVAGLRDIKSSESQYSLNIVSDFPIWPYFLGGTFAHFGDIRTIAFIYELRALLQANDAD